MAAIFISHSSLDNALAGQLKDWLAAEGYERVFLDFDKHTGLAAGEGWEARLYTELARCHAVVLVVTPNWLESKWCFAEYTQARALGKTIFPVILSAVGSLSVAADLQAIDLREWNSEGRAHLGRRLRLLTSEVARGFTWDHARPPFPGMHAFDRGDSAVFFGRDPEVREVIEKLEARRAQGGGPLLLILGGSGSGKSSLMRAGVLATIARRHENWIVLPTIRPQAGAVEGLAKAMAEALGRSADWQSWYNRLMTGEPTSVLREFARDVRIGVSTHATILLPVDQFEELYTVEAGAAERPAFLRILGAIGTASSMLAWQAIATARSDLLDQMMAHDGATRLSVETHALRPMPMDRIASLIEGPATVGAIALESGFVDRIRRDAITPDTLPLLAVALRELYDRHATQRRLTVAQYEALGDPQRGLGPLANAIRQKADRVLAAGEPTTEELAALRAAIIPAMVKVDENGAFLRQPASRARVPAKAARMVDLLVAARLLVSGESDQPDRIEVVHEALFTTWPMLSGWLEEERSFLNALARIERATSLWEERQRSPDYLLPAGAQLAEGVELARDRPAALADRPRIAEFIALSAAAEQARQLAQVREAQARLRRRVIFASASSAVLLVMLVIAGVGWWYADRAQRQADNAVREAKASQLRAIVENSSRVDPGDRGALVIRIAKALPDDRADAADLLGRSPFTAEAVTEAVLANRQIVRQMVLHDREYNSMVGGQPMLMYDAAASADGRRLIAATTAGIRLWDLAGPTPTSRMLTETVADHTINMSADGRVAAALGRRGGIEIWDLTQQAPIVRRIEQASTVPVAAMALSADGKWLAAGSRDGVRILDIAAGKWRPEAIGPPTAHVSAVEIREGNVLVAGIASNGEGFVFTGGRVIRLKPDGADIATLSVSRDGNHAVAALANGALFVWTIDSSAPKGVTVKPVTPDRAYEQVTEAVLAHDGSLALTVNRLGTVALWDLATAAREMSGLVALTDRLHGVFAPNSLAKSIGGGRAALTASPDGDVRVWNLLDGQFRHMAIGPFQSATLSTGALMADRHKGPTRIWDLRTAGAAPRVLRDDPAAADEPVALSADGRVAITISSDDRFTIWRPAGATTIAQPKADEYISNRPFALLNADGTRAAILADRSVEVWDLAGPEPRRLVSLAVNGTVTTFAISGDGRTVAASGAKDTVQVWRLDAAKPGELIVTWAGVGRLTSVALDRAGRVLAASDLNSGRVWDLSTPDKPLNDSERCGPLVALSDDGTMLLCHYLGSSRTKVSVWRLGPGGGHGIDMTWTARGSIALSFDASGRYLVGVRADGRVSRWPLRPDPVDLIDLIRRPPRD